MNINFSKIHPVQGKTSSSQGKSEALKFSEVLEREVNKSNRDETKIPIVSQGLLASFFAYDHRFDSFRGKDEIRRVEESDPSSHANKQ